jgi:hypothetical protein
MKGVSRINRKRTGQRESSQNLPADRVIVVSTASMRVAREMSFHCLPSLSTSTSRELQSLLFSRQTSADRARKRNKPPKRQTRDRDMDFLAAVQREA